MYRLHTSTGRLTTVLFNFSVTLGQTRIANCVKSLGYVLDNLGFQNIPATEHIFLSSKSSRPPLEPTQPSSGYCGSFLEIKQTGRDSSHSFPSSAEVKNWWIYISAPSECLPVVDRAALHSNKAGCLNSSYCPGRSGFIYSTCKIYMTVRCTEACSI